MADNLLTEACISTIGDVLVFWSPKGARLKGNKPRTTPSVNGRVQIIDVFSLEVATGFCRDPHGRLLLHSAASLAAGRSWSLAKAAQLIRNDARPKRWVALHQDNRAWGLFWAGGGLQRCRERLSIQANGTENCTALVPFEPEKILALVLNANGSDFSSLPVAAAPQGNRRRHIQIVTVTSLIWLIILMVVVTGFHNAFERQDRKLEVLLERTAPKTQNSHETPTQY